MRQDLGRDNTVFVHVTLIPWIAAAQELKTKPTQHSVKEMLSIGIQPDILLCRSDRAVPREMRQKIALFCNVEEPAVIAARDVASIYEVPLNFAAGRRRRPRPQVPPHRRHRARPLQVAGHRPPRLQPAGRGLHRHRRQVRRVRRLLQVPQGSPRPRRARPQPQAPRHLDRSRGPRDPRRRRHAHQRVSSTSSTASTASSSPAASASAASKACSTPSATPARPAPPTSASASACRPPASSTPATSAASKDANSGEFDPATPHRIIYKLRELTGVEEMGGTMRLGAWPCVLEPGSLAAQGLRHHRDLRAPPPPLRVQPRVRSHPHRRRPPPHRHHPRRHLRRDRRDPRPPLLPRLPVPPRVQIQAARAAPALPRLHRRQLSESSCSFSASSDANCNSAKRLSISGLQLP